jgi:hypothetical protein
LRQSLFGWNAAIHHPNAVRLAYCFSIFARKSPRVVLSLVFPASTS